MDIIIRHCFGMCAYNLEIITCNCMILCLTVKGASGYESLELKSALLQFVRASNAVP